MIPMIVLVVGRDATEMTYDGQSHANLSEMETR